MAKKKKDIIENEVNINTLQKKIYNIVKKKSFTASNLLKIVNHTIKNTQKTELTSSDFIRSILLLNKKNFASKITQLYKTEKIIPKIHRKLNPEKQALINEIYEIYKTEKGFQLPTEAFSYILNKMIIRIAKDIKKDTLEKINIHQTTSKKWNVLNYAKSRNLIKSVEEDNDIIIDTFDEDLTSDVREDFFEEEKLSELKEVIINNMGLLKESDFKNAEKIIVLSELKQSVIDNFDGDYDKAITLINNGDMTKYINQMKEKIDNIYNMKKTSNEISKSILNQEKILVISDDDNDGNTFISMFNKFKRALPLEYAENLSVFPAKILKNSTMSHGLNAAHIEELINNKIINPDEIKVLMTVDNGMSLTKKEIDKIIKLLPNARIVLTDHHLPTDNLVPENYKKKVSICNPKYKPTPYFKTKKNISGAQVGGEILKRSLLELNKNIEINNIDQTIEIIDNNSKFSNIADVVDGDITIYPFKTFDRDRLSSVSTSMNVINNMKPFIGKRVIPEDISKIFEIDLSEVEGLSNTLLYLNSISKEYIELFEKLFGREEKTYSLNEKNFSKVFSDIHKNFQVSEYEENYIAKLRPYLIELTNDNYKNIFKTKFLEHIEKVFSELKKIQIKVVDNIRKNPLNFVEDSKKLGLETERVSILVKKKSKALRYINRKMLNIALNEANNGYRAILDNVDGNKIGGSMRSLYSRKDIFEGVDNINNILNIEHSLAGHWTAAGWNIDLKDCVNKKQRYSKLAGLVKWIDNKIEILEEEEIKKKQKTSFDIQPTENTTLLLKANTLLRDSFANHSGISNFIYLDEYQVETLERKIKDNTFGWVTLDTKIMDCTLIFSNEILKKYLKLRKEGVNASLNFSTLTSGALILNNIRINDNDNFIEKDRSEEEYNERYIKENYKNNIEHCTNLDLQKQPYLSFNKYGDIEFQRIQATIISLMYRYNLSDYNILDIEGTGLAMTEEIPEISTLTLKIHEGSGSTLDISEFNERSFLSHGREILIDKKDLDNLVYLEEEEIQNSNYESKYIIFNEASQKWYFNKSKKHYPEIFSKKIVDNKVIFNQQLIGSHFHAYINDLLENIPTSIESLTHLNNDFVKKSGNSLSLKEADEALYKYFSSMDNALLSAHNLSYDYSLIRSNFPKTFDYMHKSMLLYDTAKTSQAVRTQSQQYASIELPIAIGDLANPTVKFRNYFGNDLSLEEFLDNLYENREISDKDSKFVLKVKNNNLIFIDKEKDLSAILLEDISNINPEDIKEWLQFDKNVSVAPKYSVQSLLHEKYVKMMLHKLKPVQGIQKKYSKINNILPILNEEFQIFISKYRFDNGIQDNIQTFIDYINLRYKHLSFSEGEYVIKHLLLENNPYIPEKGKKHSVRAAEKHLKDIYSDFISKIEKNLEQFLLDNKKISAAYTDRFYAEEIIKLLPENLNRITEETINNISSKTSYNVEFVKNIVEMVKEFSKINGTNVFSIGEVHNNLVAKDTHKMGDVAIEGMLAILHLLNEKYNFLNKTNLTTQAVDFIEKGIIETAKLDFNKRQKEAITTSQINSETFRIGRKLIELRGKDNVQSSFANKIETTLNTDTKLLKVNERLTQNEVLIYADIPTTYDKKEIDEVVNEIEIYLFLENLKQAKVAIESYIINLIEKNSKNFVVNFAKYFGERRNELTNFINDKKHTYLSNAGEFVDSRKTFNYFAVTSIEMYENFNDLLAQLEVETLELESEIEDLKSSGYESLNDIEKKELSAFEKSLVEISNFKIEIDKVYEKITSLNMIEELFHSINMNLELKQDELIEKYNIYFDYHTANRKSKISNDIFELLSELHEVERDSFARGDLSPKFVKRGKKPVTPSYLSIEEYESFRTELLDFINNEIINVLKLPEEFLIKVEEHLDFLLKYYFINENTFKEHQTKMLDNSKNEKEKEKYKNITINSFKQNSFSDNPKKFNNPSKEIVNAMETIGTGLSKFILNTKTKEVIKTTLPTKNKKQNIY